MTIIELKELLFQYASQGNWVFKEIQEVLLKYKEAGGKQDKAVQILNDIKNNNPNNQTIQDGIDDMLDIATGWCAPDLRVW